jgi:hypothetical protein
MLLFEDILTRTGKAIAEQGQCQEAQTKHGRACRAANIQFALQLFGDRVYHDPSRDEKHADIFHHAIPASAY